MAKAIFKTFLEASAFSKNLAMTIKASTSIKRDGDTWYVDDPRTGQGTIQPTGPANPPTNKADSTNDEASASATANHSKQYDAAGYDKDGYNKDGYNRKGFNKFRGHRDTGTAYDLAGYDFAGYNTHGFNAQKTHKVTLHGFDPIGYNAEGYNRAGHDRNGNYNADFDKNSKEPKPESGRPSLESGRPSLGSFVVIHATTDGQ